MPWHAAYTWAARTTWNARSIRVTCAVLIVAGLALLTAELRRARIAGLLAGSDHPGAAGIDTVNRTDGIAAASVKVGRRKIKVNARGTGRDNAAAQMLQEPVSAAAATRLQVLGLRRPPSVRVRVHTRSR